MSQVILINLRSTMAHIRVELNIDLNTAKQARKKSVLDIITVITYFNTHVFSEPFRFTDIFRNCSSVWFCLL